MHLPEARVGGPERRRASGARLLLALTLLNVLSYVDRQLVGALAPLLMADLGLSRAQLGLLIGAAFMVVFAAATLAMGIAADRLPRPRLLAGGVALWSAATGGSAAASGFGSLAVWRSLVGVGEATLSPTAIAMLADRFAPARLGFAAGVFYTGVPIGFALSYALGGTVGPRLGWRACFASLGMLGLVAAWLCWRMRDPRQAERGDAPAPPRLGAARALVSRPALALLMLAAALLAYASASSQLVVAWLVQERGLPYAQAAWLSALVTVTAGLLGNLGIGALTDRAGSRHPAGRLLSFAALGALSLAAAAVFYRTSPGSALFVPAFAVTQAWMLGWYGPLVAAVVERSPAPLRATAVALLLLVVNLLGVATGPWLTGVVGDRTSLTQGLLVSLAVAACGLVLVAAVGLRTSRAAQAP